MRFHKNTSLLGRHPLPFRAFVDNTARDAHVYDSNDLAKVVQVGAVAPFSYYIISEVASGVATFTEIGGGGGGGGGLDGGLSWDNTVQTGPTFQCLVGKVHVFNSTGGVITADTPVAPNDGERFAVVKAAGSNVLLINGPVLSAPAFPIFSSMPMICVFKYSASALYWYIESDLLHWFSQTDPTGQTIPYWNGSSGFFDFLGVGPEEIIGRTASSGLVSTGYTDFILPFGTLITGAVTALAEASRTNPYEATSGQTIQFPVSPNDGAEIVHQEVSGSVDPVTFDGNGNNVQDPATGTVGATFISTTARASYKFKYWYNGGVGSYWAVVAVGLAGGGGGGSDWTIGPLYAANFNAVVGEIARVNSSVLPFTATLPATPAVGDKVGFYFEISGPFPVPTNTLTINRNGNTINGVAFNPQIGGMVPFNSGLFALQWNGVTWMVIGSGLDWIGATHPPYDSSGILVRQLVSGTFTTFALATIGDNEILANNARVGAGTPGFTAQPPLGAAQVIATMTHWSAGNVSGNFTAQPNRAYHCTPSLGDQLVDMPNVADVADGAEIILLKNGTMTQDVDVQPGDSAGFVLPLTGLLGSFKIESNYGLAHLKYSAHLNRWVLLNVSTL